MKGSPMLKKILAWVIIVGGLVGTGNTVNAQDFPESIWGNKKVECSKTSEFVPMLLGAGFYYMHSGLGEFDKDDGEVTEVVVVHFAHTDGRWMIVETHGNNNVPFSISCVIGRGKMPIYDPAGIQEFYEKLLKDDK